MSSSGLVAHFVTGGKRKHMEEKLDQDIYQRVWLRIGIENPEELSPVWWSNQRMLR